ncbi:RNA recognition motif-containing protein 24 [Elsinoe fawcettii]|nr:RNA recognition motif-containing protein 24 [Elsinoe fawcettii]
MSAPGSGTSTPAGGHALPAKPGFKPRNVTSSAAPKRTASLQVQQYPSYPQGGYDMSGGYGAGAQSYGNYPQYGQQQQYGAGYDYNQYAAPTPALHNPFPMPAVGAEGAFSADAEWQQQMQQWQSNYSGTPQPKPGEKPGLNANHLPLKNNRLDPSTPTSSGAATPAGQKTVVRQGGGQKWEDSTLLEWGNLHRIFVGNLAGEVTDDSLLKAFSKWPSVQKARVVRDKRTTKSKGFGFVGFSDADEYFQAAKDMNGKYVGSHPVLIKRAETEIKVANKKDDRYKGKYKGKNGHGGGGNNKAGKIDPLAAQPGQGVQKKGKVESKYKVLG